MFLAPSKSHILRWVNSWNSIWSYAIHKLFTRYRIPTADSMWFCDKRNLSVESVLRCNLSLTYRISNNPWPLAASSLSPHKWGGTHWHCVSLLTISSKYETTPYLQTTTRKRKSNTSILWPSTWKTKLKMLEVTNPRSLTNYLPTLVGKLHWYLKANYFGNGF